VIETVTRNIMNAARKLLRNWPVIALLVILFDALLAACYLFASSREATAAQLLLTVFLAVSTAVLFLLIQAIGVSYPLFAEKAPQLFFRALRGLGKIALVTLPVILLGALIAYLMSKINFSSSSAETIRQTGDKNASSFLSTFPWKVFFLTALQYLVFVFALPLLAIHLWIAAMREGLAGAFRNIGGVIRAAFSPSAILIYTLGLLAFGVVPYFLFFTRTPINRAWVEIIVLGLRLALAFILVLFGWTLTLGALSERNAPVAANLPATPTAEV
jgi:hypothetical protein